MLKELLVAVLFAGAACGSSSTAATGTTPSPTPDAAVIAYRNLIGNDFKVIYHAFDKPPCASRTVCVEQVMATVSTTQALIKDIDKNQAPPALIAPAVQVRDAALRFIADLNSAIAAMNRPSTPYQAIVNALSIDDLDLAVANLDCFPRQPKNYGGEGDFSCG